MKRVTTTFVLASSLVALPVAFSADAANSHELSTPEQQLGYAMGVQTAKSFQEHHINIDLNAYTQGMSDVYNNKTLLMDDKTVTQTLVDFQKQQMVDRQEKQQAQAADNQKASDAFLADNQSKPGVKTLSDGIQYKVISQGNSKSTKATTNDIVTVDYEGSLPDGTVFDSSYKRGQPATFPLSGVIKGWQIALAQMPIGATWEIFIPSNLAYGESGTPDGSIGPNQALIFKVHLISAKPTPE